jgi:parvulin-like peptidyl-prolyl isomerase
VHRVLKQTASAVLVASLAVALAACKGTQSAGPGGGDVAATVNGKNITLSEVDRIISQQAKSQQAKTLSPIERATARLQVLDTLIQRQVLVQRAEKEKTAPSDDELNTYVNTQRSKFTAEEWEKNLRESNLTEAQLRDEARRDLSIRKLQEKLYGKITIRDQEIADFYNNNKEQFVNSRGVYLSDIVADPFDYAGQYPDDAKSDAEAKAKIDRLYTQLRGGADFATVARVSSEDPSRIRGGDIGFATEVDLKQNGFPAELINRLFNSMKVGDITEPVRFDNGRWYIFKLTDRQLQSENLALDSPGVRDQIKNALINQRQTLLNEALIRNAMSDAQITNYLAQNMLNDPSALGGLEPVSAGGAASPSATAPPAASTSPSATATPAAPVAPSPERK